MATPITQIRTTIPQLIRANGIRQSCQLDPTVALR
jgi:hypothetical protein